MSDPKKGAVVTAIGAALLPQMANAAEPVEASAAAQPENAPIIQEKGREIRYQAPILGTRNYETMPDVLIQHVAKGRTYYIPATEIAAFKADRTIWQNLGPDTVVFSVPDTEFIEAVPPFLRIPKETPSILIQHARGKASYFVSSEQLSKYDVTGKEVNIDPERVSFSVPFGTELVEKMPEVVQAMLQSGEWTGPIIPT